MMERTIFALAILSWIITTALTIGAVAFAGWLAYRIASHFGVV